jgi:hypothetical protein
MAHVIFLWERTESQGDGSVIRRLPCEHEDLNSTPEPGRVWASVTPEQEEWGREGSLGRAGQAPRLVTGGTCR